MPRRLLCSLFLAALRPRPGRPGRLHQCQQPERPDLPESHAGEDRTERQEPVRRERGRCLRGPLLPVGGPVLPPGGTQGCLRLSPPTTRRPRASPSPASRARWCWWVSGAPTATPPPRCSWSSPASTPSGTSTGFEILSVNFDENQQEEAASKAAGGPSTNSGSRTGSSSMPARCPFTPRASARRGPRTSWTWSIPCPCSSWWTGKESWQSFISVTRTGSWVRL